MKTILLAVLCCSLFFMTSCSKTDDKGRQISITSVTPLKAKPNQRLEVKGSGFTHLADSANNIKVYFGGVPGNALVISDSLIEVYVPSNAQSGPICVDYRNSRYCSDTTFTILPGNYLPNTFTRLPDYPGFYNGPGSMFAIDKDVYVGFDEFWKFDTEKLSWSKVASMPYYSVNTAAFSIQGKGYIFGGLTGVGDGSDRIWEYDPVKNVWTEKTPMPAGKRYGSVCFLFNNKAYIAGGEPAYNMPSTRQELWEYDPSLDKWTRKTDLPIGTMPDKKGYSLKHKFYVSAGAYGTQEYDPVTNTWRVVLGPDTQYRAFHASSKWESITYLIDALPFQHVYRLMLSADNQMVTTSLIHSPAASSQKVIHLYTSVGDELFMIHVDSNNRLVEFWEYLAE